MRKDYDIVGSYNNQRVSSIDCERTVNCFEFIDNNGKRPKTLIFTSGITNTHLDFSPETGGSRATFVFKNITYEVMGGSIYIINGETGSLFKSKIGSLGTNQGWVGIQANTYQVIFVDGEKGYIWDTLANTYNQITDESFPSRPIDVASIDGFFIVAEGQTNSFRMCSYNQGMVWGSNSPETITATDVSIDTISISSTNNFRTGVPITFVGGGIVAPLDTTSTFYAVSYISGGVINPTQIRVATSAENARNGVFLNLLNPEVGTVGVVGELQQGFITSHAGNIVACRTLHRQLFLFSEYFTEVWENAGIGTTLPIRRNNGLLMEVGTPAIGSISVGFDRMFFLSQDRDGLGSVMEVKGTQSIPVSNRALDFQLAQYAADPLLGVSDCRGILIKENGLIFYRMNFTSANHTFVLNVSMSTQENPLWHEEETLDGNRHPAQTHAFYKGVNYYGDYNSPIFYKVDPNVTTNNGQSIRRMRIGKPISPEGYNRLRIDRFQLDLLQGNVEETIVDEQFLETEGGDDLLTESGDLILLEQQSMSPSSAPVVFFSYSKNGGKTYGNVLQGTMGNIGQFTYRTVWRKLGTIPRGQSFIPKFEFYNQVPFVVLGAAWDFEVLPE